MTAPTDQPPTAWDPAPLPAPGPSGWTPAPTEGRPLPQQQARPSVPYATAPYPGGSARRGRGKLFKSALVLLVVALVSGGLVVYAVMSPTTGPATFSLDYNVYGGTTTLSWIDDGGHLSGTYQSSAGSVDAEDDTPGIADEPSSAPMTGTRVRDQVSISISGPLGLSQTLLGTVSGDTLTLRFPNDDGTMGGSTMIRTTEMGLKERVGTWATETFRLNGAPATDV